MSSVDGTSVQVDGTNFHVRWINRHASGSPIVFLHGYLTYSFTWFPVINHLTTKAPLLLVDLPGSGASARLKRHDAISAAELARRLVRLLDKEGIAECRIVGSQMGGSLAGFMLAHAPERFQSAVILAAGALGESGSNVRLYKLLCSPLTGPLVRHFMPRRLFLKKWRAAHGTAYMGNMQRELEFYRHFRRRGSEMTYLGLAVRASYGGKFERLAGLLKGVDTETLLIWGRDDRVVPLSTADKLARLLPNSRLIVLDGVGDFPQEEVPETVARLMDSFFSNRRGTRALTR